MTTTTSTQGASREPVEDVRPPAGLERRRVYVWEAPVRWFHWINALALFVLIGTGLWIGDPLSIQADDASAHDSFAVVRLVHFVAAYVAVAAALLRLYWAFAGNRYASWRNYVPHRWSQLRDLWRVIRVDVLQMKGDAREPLGHNALASFAYLGVFALFLFQVATGFGMYAAMSDSWFPQLFAWVVPLLGGDANARHWHHLATWGFVIFLIIHLYLSFYHDLWEGRGVLSSIFNGWKYADVEREHRAPRTPDADMAKPEDGP